MINWRTFTGKRLNWRLCCLKPDVSQLWRRIIALRYSPYNWQLYHQPNIASTFSSWAKVTQWSHQPHLGPLILGATQDLKNSSTNSRHKAICFGTEPHSLLCIRAVTQLFHSPDMWTCVLTIFLFPNSDFRNHNDGSIYMDSTAPFIPEYHNV